jgi:carbon-monoxide dehydrogenase large subunit
MKLPEGVPTTLDVSHVHEAAPSAYPNGTHVAEVEIDPDTGHVEVAIDRYAIGRRLRHGRSTRCWSKARCHGGVAQGIGQALIRARRLRASPASSLTGSLTWTMRSRARAICRRSASTDRLSLGARDHERAGRQGLRRGGLRGRAALSVMNAVV